MRTLNGLLEEKKDKTGISLLRQWLFKGKELNEIQVAKAISTTITHCLIEVEHIEDMDEAVDAAISYHVDSLTTILNNLIMGKTDLEVSRRVILRLLEGDANVPSE